jgi:ATP-binding protein involved in chromosome partitioning
MTVDEVRRAWVKVAEETGVPARLVALGRVDTDAPTPMRGRTVANWTDRLRFEAKLAELLGDDAGGLDLQWLAPPARSKSSGKDRARAKLGLAPRPEGKMEVGQMPSDGTPRPLTPGKRPIREAPKAVPGVKQVLAVASGKGGVGKSTVSVNLAVALQARGLRVGLLDADVYGPSMPTMLGSFTAPTRQGEIFTPPEADGIPFLSLGLMVNPDQSVIWRGPLVQRMVRDMLQKTAWPDLDLLIIDLPPGTGDVQLTLVQRALLAGAIIVSTPQDIALIDAARALHMFSKLNVPVLGIVENMASYACNACGAESHPFGHGGAEREAKRLDVPFMGRIPLDEAVREGGDSGTPSVRSHPESASSLAFADLAKQVAERLILDSDD